MKQIRKSDLQIGSIICIEVKLYGREAFEVIDPRAGRNYISVKSRSTHKQKKLMINENSSVILLHENPPGK